MGQLFSKKNKEVFSTPLGLNNPVTVQVLGICSALAVTAKLEPAIVMGLSVTVITAFSNVVISLLRKTIPNRIRIIVQLVVVAALVTIVSEILKAFAYDVSVQLSVYVGLIITNCILMGRLEAFAMQNGPWESFLDGVGNGLGYAKILVIVAFFRELLGSGTLLGFNILNYEPLQKLGYVNNGLMLMPPMALILCACIIWYQRARHKELQEKQIRAKEYYADEYSLIYYDEELGINESTGNVIDFINVYENGGFIQPRTIQHTSQVIHKFYPAFTFHSLRHTHCTRLLEAGLPIKYVQERLGHKNISVTMDIYNHLTQNQAELSKRALEDVFK